jgi:hypothetical protein
MKKLAQDLHLCVPLRIWEHTTYIHTFSLNPSFAPIHFWFPNSGSKEKIRIARKGRARKFFLQMTNGRGKRK